MKKALALCLALAAGLAGTAPVTAQDEPQPTVRDYELHHLDARVAEALFWDLCPADPGDGCQVLLAMGNLIRVRAPVAVQRRMARLLAERDVLPTSHRLQIHLLTAEAGGRQLPEGLPPGARQALDDLASVLPYGRFHLLDTAVVETVNVARVNLAGPRGVVLDAALDLQGVTGLEGEKLHLDLRLSSGGSVEQPPGEGGPQVRPGTLLSTSLSLARGETVVVGTSRAGSGDQALVVLLTALP
jgi:hypothetical protein